MYSFMYMLQARYRDLERERETESVREEQYLRRKVSIAGVAKPAANIILLISSESGLLQAASLSIPPPLDAPRSWSATQQCSRNNAGYSL